MRDCMRMGPPLDAVVAELADERVARGPRDSFATADEKVSGVIRRMCTLRWRLERREDRLLALDPSSLLLLLLFGPLVDAGLVGLVLPLPLLLLLFWRDECSGPKEIMPADESPPSRVAPRPVPMRPENKLRSTALAAAEPLLVVVVVEAPRLAAANGMMLRKAGRKKSSCWAACASSSPITFLRHTGHVACFKYNSKFKTRFRKKYVSDVGL